MRELLSGIAEILFIGPWSRVWPFFVLPALALLSLRGALVRIESGGGDPRRQARLAAFAACVPGLITLALAIGLGSRIRGTQPESLNCYAKLYGPIILGSIALLRAGTLLAARRVRVARLLRYAGPPSSRLAAIAAEVGVPVREVALEASVCFVSGLLRPCVVVSTGTLRTLSDSDLRAALLHERAHLRSRDVFWATLITAVGEFGLLSSRRALRLYRSGRESMADDEAARQVGPAEIAGVLVRFARNAAPVALPSSLAEAEGLEHRVRRLIAPETGRRSESARAMTGLAAAAALAFYPLAAHVLEVVVFHCGK